MANTLAVLGAGTMGHGIAHAAMAAGCTTRLYDPSRINDGDAALEGSPAVHALLGFAVARRLGRHLRVRVASLRRVPQPTLVQLAKPEPDLDRVARKLPGHVLPDLRGGLVAVHVLVAARQLAQREHRVRIARELIRDGPQGHQDCGDLDVQDGVHRPQLAPLGLDLAPRLECLLASGVEGKSRAISPKSA